MLQKIKIFLIAILVINIAACSHIYGERGYLKDRDYDYLKARSIPPMRVPPGLSSEKISPNYPVPERSYPPQAARIDLSPPGLYRTDH